MTWALWAAAAAASWGVWGLASGLASRHGGASGVMAGAVMMESICVLPFLSRVRSSWSWWLVVSGAAGVFAWWSMIRGLKTGPTTGVVALSSLYPAVTAVLAVMMLRESLTSRMVTGIALAVLAGWLIGGK